MSLLNRVTVGRRGVLGLVVALWLSAPAPARPADTNTATAAGDRMLAAYFAAETARISTNCLADIQSLADWTARREQYRQQLFDMLGLWPLPEKTELKPVVTGRLETNEFTVEMLHYQSMPGCYVTANLYLPKGAEKPAPAVLYLCGHASVITNKVSYGNKTAYQHHGIWFARHGYVCLVLDSVQLGELQGIHHGTYREKMWWWNSRGYTPAGAEAWNCIRALDYLQTRPEVDAQRLGVTGRSGGGAYSWWVAALDERVKVAAPVAGITDLRNHVVDGAVEGHCDCMFMLNACRWDFPQVAALVAPRPLLIANSDKDSIFPLDGVVRLHAQVRRIYDLYKAGNKLGLLITEGPHSDTQDLQLPVFRWFNRHLKGQDLLIETAAVKMFPPADLKVFDQLPGGERTTRLHETFVPMAAPPAIPESAEAWARQRDQWMAGLRSKVFGGWPDAPAALELQPTFAATRQGVRLEVWDFTSQPEVRLRLCLARKSGLEQPKRLILNVLDQAQWEHWQTALGETLTPDAARRDANAGAQGDSAALATLGDELRVNDAVFVYFAPRGIGPTAWTKDERKQTQIRRRFMLLGQTLDGMRVWDIRRAIQGLHSLEGLSRVPLSLGGEGLMAVNALYAGLFEPAVDRFELRQLPTSHAAGPDYLNVLRVLDMPQAAALAAERATVVLDQPTAADWEFPAQVSQKLGWPPTRFTVRCP